MNYKSLKISSTRPELTKGTLNKLGKHSTFDSRNLLPKPMISKYRLKKRENYWKSSRKKKL